MLNIGKKWMIFDAVLILYLLGLLLQHSEINFSLALSVVPIIALLLVNVAPQARNSNYDSSKLIALSLLCLVLSNQLIFLGAIYKPKAGNGFESISSFVLVFTLIIGWLQIYSPKPKLKMVYYGVMSFCSIIFAAFLVFLIVYCVSS